VDAGDDCAILFIADFFRKNTRQIDKQKYIISYRELNVILRKHRFLLENPIGNFIDIMRAEEIRSFPIIGKKRIKKTKIGMIRFPGWSKEVSQSDVATVRRKTHLAGC